VTRGGKLVGIVSRSNLIQALPMSHAPNHTTDADRTIRLELLSRLGKQSWTCFGCRNVVVSNGVVHLWGLIGSPDERKALLALAEEVPGVSSVCDAMIPAY